MAILCPLVHNHGDQLVTCCCDCKCNGSALCVVRCCLYGNGFLAQNIKRSCWMHQKIYWCLVHVDDEMKIMLRSKEHWTDELLELHRLLHRLSRRALQHLCFQSVHNRVFLQEAANHHPSCHEGFRSMTGSRAQALMMTERVDTAKPISLLSKIHARRASFTSSS